MKNFISLNGKKIELTDEQVEKILAENKNLEEKVLLSNITEGGTFKIGEDEFIVLEHHNGETAVIRKNMLRKQKFGATNNFDGSDVQKTCQSFFKKIALIVGDENIVEHKVDLTALDGMKCYGAIRSRCSLLTVDLYRKYVEILDEFKTDEWWWLSTPFSTKKHANDVWGLCVSPAGFVDFGHFNYFDIGVRPFCILKSTIFVSK